MVTPANFLDGVLFLISDHRSSGRERKPARGGFGDMGFLIFLAALVVGALDKR